MGGGRNPLGLESSDKLARPEQELRELRSGMPAGAGRPGPRNPLPQLAPGLGHTTGLRSFGLPGLRLRITLACCMPQHGYLLLRPHAGLWVEGGRTKWDFRCVCAVLD